MGFLAAFQQQALARSLECTDAALRSRGAAVVLRPPGTAFASSSVSPASSFA